MEKQLNILFLCSWYPNPDEKSNGIFIKRHALALSLKHKVTVVFVKSVELKEELTITNEEENFTEHLVFYPKVKTRYPLTGPVSKFLKFKKAYKTALDRLPAEAFDIIHLNTVFPAAIPALYALKKYPSAKLFITEHWSGYYPEDGNYKGKLVTYYTRKIIAKANAVFVISDKLKNSMLAHGLKNTYARLNNVVDTVVFKPVNLASDNGVLKILHVSSLVEREKNISGIIAVANYLKQKQKPFHLTIIGENTTEIATHNALVQQYNLMNEISFEGFKHGEEIADYMNRSDVFLLLSHYEGMPVVVLEALACGLPVITSNVGEVKQMIKPGMGIVLQHNTLEACVDSLMNYRRELFTNAEEMHHYIHSTYSPEAVCKHITHLYNSY